MTHTKGKWEVDEIRGCKVVVCGSMVIASDLFDENEEPSIEELDANANLIASAPEMLELLEEIRGIAEARDEVYPDDIDMLYRMLVNIGGLADKAIAKAEGK